MSLCFERKNLDFLILLIELSISAAFFSYIRHIGRRQTPFEVWIAQRIPIRIVWKTYCVKTSITNSIMDLLTIFFRNVQIDSSMCEISYEIWMT